MVDYSNQTGQIILGQMKICQIYSTDVWCFEEDCCSWILPSRPRVGRCLVSYKMWNVSLQWMASSLNANSNVISLISHHNGFSWVSNVDLLLPSLPLLSYHMRAAVNQFLLYCWFPQWFCAVGYRVSTKQRVEYQLTNRRLLDHRVIGPACSTHQHTRRCWAGWRPLHVDE